MGGDGHDGAGAVVHEDVVGDPERNPLSVEGVDRAEPRVDAQFLGLFALLQVLEGLADPLGQLFAPRRGGDDLLHEGVLGGEGHEGRPEDGVDPGREDRQLLLELGDREDDLRSQALADPVLLHQQNLLRPEVQLLMAFQELFGVVGDLEKPLGELLLFDIGVTTPTAVVHDLLVGQDGLAGGAPVDPTVLLVGQPPFVHLQEDPLVPTVVFGVAGGKLPLPVVGEAEPLKLALHGGDVLLGPDSGSHAVFDGGVFRGQTERVPSDGVEDVEALHPFETAEDIPYGVVAYMPHVDSSGGVRKHLQAVKLGSVGIFLGAEGLLIVPAFLPLLLQGMKIVLRYSFSHGLPLRTNRKSRVNI